MAKFLDFTGLSHTIDKLKEWVNTRLNSEVTIKVVKVNGQPLSPDTGKAVNVDLTAYAIKTEVTKEIAEAVSGIKGFEAQVVPSLPQTGEKGILYLVPNSGSGQKLYDEYLWVNEKFEKLGTREIDLTAYAKKSELPTKTSQLTNDSGFLTEIPSEYVTDTEMNGELGKYALKTEIPTIESITTTEIDGLFQ